MVPGEGGQIGPLAPLALLAILLGSCAVFWWLVRQWTTQRRWAALDDWAEANGLALRRHVEAPPVLKAVWDPVPKALVWVGDERRAMMQVQTPGLAGRSDSTDRVRWNLLVRQMGGNWPVAGLRPRAHANSILDYLPLTGMQAMAPGPRFVLYTGHVRVGRALVRSSLRALLPPDVGMLICEDSLVLDFSTRPFDPLELQRMDALAEQLTGHLGAIEAALRSGGQ